MKRFTMIFFSVFLWVQVWAQTESCILVINELTKNKDVWPEQVAIDYVLAHKDSFDMENEIDIWLYSIALGTRYYPLGKYSEALPYLRNITTMCDTYGNELGLDSNPQLLAAYYWEADCEFHTHASKEIVLSKLQRAKFVYEKYKRTDIEIYEDILSSITTLQSGAIDLLSIIQTAIGYAISGKNQEAIPLFEQIINKWPTSRPKKELASYVQALGICYITVGRLDDAEELYLNMLANLKDEQELEVYRYICDALGVLYCQVHNYQKAKDFSGLSKQLHEKYMDFDDSYIRCLSNCALAEYGLGNFFVAKLFIDVALKYIKKGVGYSASKTFIDGISKVTLITGIKTNVDSISDQANLMFQVRPYIKFLSNAAMIYQEAGFWDDAVVCIKECIAISEEIEEPNAFIYNNLATMYLAQFRVDESLPYFSKALSLCQTDYEKNEVVFNYALALWLNHSQEYIDIATQASQILINSITSNFAFLSQEERTNFYKQYEYCFPILNRMFYESGDENLYGHIYDNILTTKGLLLRTTNTVKDVIMESGNEQVISDYNRMVSLRQNIIREQNSVRRNDMIKEAEQIDKRLSRNAAKYDAFAKSNNSIKWQDIRASLNDDDIAIEFCNLPIILSNDTVQRIDFEPIYCAIFLKKDYENPHIVALCKEGKLKELDQDILYDGDLIYRLIWEPLEKDLTNIKNIYFAADGELHQIAIEYAQLPDKSRIDDKFNLYRLSSTRVLAEERYPEISNNAVLFGGLRYDLDRDRLIAESRECEFHSAKVSRTIDLENLRYGVEYLPGTKDEVEAIAQKFESTKEGICEVITDTAGTEEAFRALANKNIGIIHLATHGFFWDAEDADRRRYISFLSNLKNQNSHEDAALLRSGLLFSGANISLAGEQLPDDVEDGVLTAQELSAMNLGNVDMVVMSACQSGLGETSGEGVFGLQRGFKLAGANTLLMSLWKVDDEATKLLMTEFYRNLLAGNSKLVSLRNAQQYIKSQSKYNLPEYWAGFILLDALK